MLELTRADNNEPVYIRKSQIVAFTAEFEHGHGKAGFTGRTIVHGPRDKFFVKETVDDIKHMIPT